MSNEKPPSCCSGEPEFLITDNGSLYYEGISLRHWFAEMAMKVMLSVDTDNVSPSLELVKAAYEYADQMLEAMKK